LRHCRHNVVDVLITDLVMPECEGIETIRYFRKEVPYVKIIAISGAFEGQLLAAAEVPRYPAKADSARRIAWGRT